MLFQYPQSPQQRKHGPGGYKDYDSYRPWLRDDFCFRCVYCLRREQWGLVSGNWDLDHFEPQSQAPDEVLNYDNLIYVCHTCNLNKSTDLVPDPCQFAYGLLVEVDREGNIAALDDDGEALIQGLRLNNEDYTRFRRIWIAILATVQEHNPSLYLELMSYPNDLPNLSRQRPPHGNNRKKGVANSCYARRERGELPQTY